MASLFASAAQVLRPPGVETAGKTVKLPLHNSALQNLRRFAPRSPVGLTQKAYWHNCKCASEKP